MDRIPLTFQAEITQHSPMENSGFTLCRARVFYKGMNRNGSFIDDDFAQILINSASGCPVVGLWDTEKQDFTDHSQSDRKRAYGFIPENPNFAWEEHYDYDGIERQYASFDIVLWTKAFKEANEIISHPLSMELNPDTVNGTFSVINGEYCFYFTSAEMLGVCVLGYSVEPCFEGAAFIGIEEVNEFKRLFQVDKQQALLTYNNKGDTSMEKDEKEKDVTPIEEFAQVRDDDLDFVEETEVKAEVNEEVNTESEFSKVETSEDNNSDEKEEDNFEAIKEQFEKNIAELERQKLDFENKIKELEDKVTNLEQSNFSLMEYKNNKIKQEKENVIKNYENILTEDEIKNIEVDKYSLEELDDKLAAMAYRKNINQNPANFQLIFTDNEQDENSVSAIIQKYKKEI